jgi:hypothetical protein
MYLILASVKLSLRGQILWTNDSSGRPVAGVFGMVSNQNWRRKLVGSDGYEID